MGSVNGKYLPSGQVALQESYAVCIGDICNWWDYVESITLQRMHLKPSQVYSANNAH